eukprot:TRINITY_DN9928_c0_g1_i1.p1 TRINITY_DN9928_c0_g1~~TRINITY_DN9928_c0_g1_i1.p1  ORF type:complete len:243 (+),score=64.70 TRINITY_DN9928_c0_g1_i1:87-815(+)
MVFRTPVIGGRQPLRRHPKAAALTLVCVAAVAVLNSSRRAGDAFLSTGGAGSRREALLAASMATVSSAAVLPEVAHADVPPPLLKALERTRERIQDGIDWFFFELRPALDDRNWDETKKCLGAASVGAYISPFDQLVSYQVSDLVENNLDSEDLGWDKMERRIQTNLQALRDDASAQKGDMVIEDWDQIRLALVDLTKGVNEVTGKKTFIVPTPEYALRRQGYIQKLKDQAKARADSALLMR